MLTSAQHHIDVATYWDRRYGTAQSRFIRAVESLARIRKLKLPNLQLNIGEKQINVSGLPANSAKQMVASEEITEASRLKPVQ
jgi:hypothetical protein